MLLKGSAPVKLICAVELDAYFSPGFRQILSPQTPFGSQRTPINKVTTRLNTHRI